METKDTAVKKKRFGGDFCCVPNCANQRGKDARLGRKRSYYSFPKEPRRRNLWLQNIRRGGGWQPRSWDRVCLDHFTYGKKTDIPGSDGYLPSIFPHSKNSEPRPTRTSVAAGYISLPKTWHHIRHHLSRATKRQLTCTLGPPASSGRPPKQPRFDICVTQSLKQCGHDYLQTTCEDMPSLPVDLLRDLASIEKLRNENELLKLRMLTLSNVKCNDKLFQFYTNIPNFHVFDAVREYLQSRLTDGSNTMRRWRGAKQSCNQFSETSETNKPQISGYSDKLSFEEELFLVLVKLKTGRMNQDLAFHFDISVGLVSELFTSWLYFLSVELKALFEIVECGPVADGVPSVYRNMSDLRIVLDCTELMLQKPSDLQEREETFSNYKHHETVKFLVGMSPQLYINYISKAYGGRASDKHITLQSNSLLQSLPPGAQVMADRGFTVSQDLRKLGVRTIIPAFKGRGRPQLTAAECSQSEDVAKARIHIERIIQRIRTFHILGSVVRLNMSDIIEQLFTVCAYLTNFQSPIIQLNEIKSS